MAKNEWFTFPASDDDGRTVIVTGRLDVEKYRSRERNSIRVEVTLPYTPEGEFGFPCEKDAELLEKITEAFEEALKGKTRRFSLAYIPARENVTGCSIPSAPKYSVLSSTAHLHHFPRCL